MFCSKCGSNVGENVSFCEKCGAPIGGSQTNATHTNYANNVSIPPKQSKNFFEYLIDVHKNILKNYVNFNGRVSRKEYWQTGLVIIGVMLALSLVSSILFAIAMDIESIPLIIISIIPLLATLAYSIAIIVPLYGLAVRRLHDTDKSGWFLLLSFVPYIGSIIVFVFTVLDSQPGDNQYGPNPKM